MINRLYVNNFRCLVAFEAHFQEFGLLCGPNGAGKSSVFNALRVLCEVASGDMTVEQTIGYDDQTDWIDSDLVEFELDLTSGGHAFKYLLHIQQMSESVKPRIVKEQATCNGKLLFQRDLDGVTFDTGKGFPLDWRRAALGSIVATGSRQEIEILQREVSKILILRPNPLVMGSESNAEHSQPDLYLSNLVSWYRYLAQEQEWSDHLRESLKSVWPDFRSFRLQNTGLQSKMLQLRFEANGGKNGSSELRLDQLSDGEKMLVGLYMILSALATGGIQTLLIDEPDNFVGLPELQPWVMSLMELLGEGTQAILISHHPEILNPIGEHYGSYLWRANHSSPTRQSLLKAVEGLTLSETIARGWVNA